MNATVPFPLPDAPPVMLIHDALDAAVHAHPLALVTATLPLPPVASTDWLDGAIAKLHGGGGAGCDTVSVSPAIVRVPVRAAPLLGVALYTTAPLPVPLAPREIDIHATFDVAVHEQPLSAVTWTVFDPPAAGTV